VTPSWTSPAHPLWRWLLAVCSLASAAALFAGPHLPSTDLPQHVAMIATFRHWFDPAWRFQETFTLALGQTQYLAYYLAGALLAVPLGSAERANLVLLGAIAVGFPYSLRSLLRALRQDERLALLGCALFFNQSLLIGFYNYLAAIPVTLWALALAVRQAEAPTLRRAVALAALAVSLFYLHLSALVFFLPAAALVTWLMPQPAAARDLGARLLRLWRPLWWTLPVGALGLLWLVTSPVVHPKTVGWSEPMSPGFMSPRVALHEFPEALLDIWRGRADNWLMVALGLAALALLAPWGKPPPEPGSRWRRGVAASLLGFALVLYFAMPHSIGWLFVLNTRYAVIAALVLPATIRVAPGVRGAALLLLSAAVSLALCANAALQVRAFSLEAGDVDGLLARTQPGKRLQAVILEPESTVAKFLPYHHFGALYRARYGGVAEYCFADLPQSPVRYRPDAAPPPKPPGWEWDQSFRNEIDGPYFDYVLWRGPPEAFPPQGPGPTWKLLGRDGRWALFEKAAAP
jgi:hypothetical protein